MFATILSAMPQFNIVQELNDANLRRQSSLIMSLRRFFDRDAGLGKSSDSLSLCNTQGRNILTIR